MMEDLDPELLTQFDTTPVMSKRWGIEGIDQRGFKTAQFVVEKEGGHIPALDNAGFSVHFGDGTHR
ncbi:MAG: hypothetical protein FJY97_11940 [candidate division Zixibacteria bacterium]|nr:hypothetical protein [candidate division Zixibacteria bacterium]